MFKDFISNCFSQLKDANSNDIKNKFGLVWAVFASKVVRLKTGDIQLSWRDISAQLAQIANEWKKSNFTTDAFLNVFDHKRPYGQNAEYDEVLKTIKEHPECVGIYNVSTSRPSPCAQALGIMEVNIVTGEISYFKQNYSAGKPVGDKSTITRDEYDAICYGA
jgi:hypothetical protein